MRYGCATAHTSPPTIVALTPSVARDAGCDLRAHPDLLCGRVLPERRGACNFEQAPAAGDRLVRCTFPCNDDRVTVMPAQGQDPQARISAAQRTPNPAANAAGSRQ